MQSCAAAPGGRLRSPQYSDPFELYCSARVGSWHMAGIFGAAVLPSLVWGTADQRRRYGTLPFVTLEKMQLGDGL